MCAVHIPTKRATFAASGVGRYGPGIAQGGEGRITPLYQGFYEIDEVAGGGFLAQFGVHEVAHFA